MRCTFAVRLCVGLLMSNTHICMPVYRCMHTVHVRRSVGMYVLVCTYTPMYICMFGCMHANAYTSIPYVCRSYKGMEKQSVSEATTHLQMHLGFCGCLADVYACIYLPSCPHPHWMHRNIHPTTSVCWQLNHLYHLVRRAVSGKTNR